MRFPILLSRGLAFLGRNAPNSRLHSSDVDPIRSAGEITRVDEWLMRLRVGTDSSRSPRLMWTRAISNWLIIRLTGDAVPPARAMNNAIVRARARAIKRRERKRSSFIDCRVFHVPFLPTFLQGSAWSIYRASNLIEKERTRDSNRAGNRKLWKHRSSREMCTTNMCSTCLIVGKIIFSNTKVARASRLHFYLTTECSIVTNTILGSPLLMCVLISFYLYCCYHFFILFFV